MVSNSTSFGPTAMVADTKTQVGSTYTIERDATIKKIRITGYNGVTDKAESCILTLECSRTKGPFEWSCYMAGGEVTVGGKRPTEIIEVDIPVTQGETLSVYGTASEALEDCIVSLSYV